jgi:hypothetical protein
MLQGQLWNQMNATNRSPAETITRPSIPDAPGVYAWYREGEPVYAGKAKNLKTRLWTHLATTPDLSRSAFRRNVCEHLGIADTSITKQRPTRMKATDVEPVNTWIRQCEIGWIELATPGDAVSVEARLLAEWSPPLNRL